MTVFQSLRSSGVSRAFSAGLVLCLAACGSAAQQRRGATGSPETGAAPQRGRLTFDVATVKPVDPAKVHTVELRVYPGGRLVLHSQTFPGLIAEAFDLAFWQLQNGEKWLKDQQFDIEALPPEEVRSGIEGGEYSNFGLQNPDERAMLQSLLIDRFHLKYHIEKRPGTVYLLQRSDAPLKLQQVELHLYEHAPDGSVKPSSPYPTGDLGLASGAPVGFYLTSMAQFAGALSGNEKAPVIDQTGLTGFYNFRSKTIVTDEDFKSGAVFRLILEAVPEMGLKLVKTQGEVEKFVIDGADLPTAN